MSEITIACIDCVKFGREEWTVTAEVDPLTEQAVRAVFFALLHEHHWQTHIINASRRIMNGGDNDFAVRSGREKIGQVAVSSESQEYQLY